MNVFVFFILNNYQIKRVDAKTNPADNTTYTFIHIDLNCIQRRFKVWNTLLQKLSLLSSLQSSETFFFGKNKFFS